MIRINTQTLTFALGCLLLGASSCSRENDFQSGDKLLKVNVQMASPMLTRGATTSPIISDTIDMGNDLVLVATSRPRDYEPQEALTRGTPIRSAATLPSMNIKVYNSGTGSFSNSTALKTTLKGTNSSGAWSLSPSYVLKDGEKNTYMAYSPIGDVNNGILMALDGREISYDARSTTVANQPDLCSAAIIKDDVTGNLSFAMQHRLTAVGFKVSADNVTINEIKINNVRPSGTLTLETGVWSDLSTTSNFSPILSTITPATGGSMDDITAANGYLMLPPQTFSVSNQEVTVKYTYAGGTQQTASYPLRNLTGGKWDAGQIVTYEIQLKAKFSLTTSTTSLSLQHPAGTASFIYTTNSPSANDPQFNNGGNAWITNIQVNRSTKTVTFNYATNALTVARTATMKATSGWTEKDITVKQLNDPDLGSFIPRFVLAAAGWPANSLPTKGLQVAVRGSKVKPGGTPAAEDPIYQAKTSSTRTTGVEWISYYAAAVLGVGKSNTDAMTIPSQINLHPAAKYCREMGPEWYFPSLAELKLIHTNRSLLGDSYRFDTNSAYFASSVFNNQGTAFGCKMHFSTGLESWYSLRYASKVRCVREI